MDKEDKEELGELLEELQGSDAYREFVEGTVNQCNDPIGYVPESTVEKVINGMIEEIENE